MDPAASRYADLQKIFELHREAETAVDLNQLKTAFYRVEEIARQYPQDGELIAAADAVRSLIRERGSALAQGAPPSTPASQPPMAMPQPGAMPTDLPDPGLPPAAPVGGMLTSAFASSSGELPPPMMPQDSELPPMGAPPTPMAPLGLPAATPGPMAAMQPAPPVVPAPAAINWKVPIIGGGLIGLLFFAGGIVLWKKPFRKPPPPPVVQTQQPSTYAVSIQTDPVGAQIQIDGQARCVTPDCKLELLPGDHQVSASLAGFEPQNATLKVVNLAASLDLKLKALPPSLRVSSNLEGWRVALDDAKPVEMVNNQWSVDTIAPGKHLLRLIGKTGEARVAVNIPEAAGAPPEVESITASNVLALALAGAGKEVKLKSSQALTLQVEGQPPATLKAQEAAEVGTVPPGERPVQIGEGKDQRKVLMSFSPAAGVSISLLQNTTTGALVIVTGEDNVQVFVDNKAQRRLTAKGQARVYNLEPGVHSVRVAKDGFQPVVEQKLTVKKGEETKVDFKMVALPRVATLHIRGAVAGAAVWMNGAQVGTVQPDGNLTVNNVPPGEQTVEFRLRPYANKQVARRFVAGQTVEISGADVSLSKSPGKVVITHWVPAEAQVVIKRGDTVVATLDRNKNTVELPEGTYSITAHAPGYEPANATMKLDADREVHPNIDLGKLKAGGGATARTGMDGWMDAAGWEKQGDWNAHQAANAPVLFGATPTDGTFTFTVTLLKGRGAFSNHPIRWMVDYRGPGDFVLCTLDKKNFERHLYRGGIERDPLQVKHGQEKANAYSIRVRVDNSSVTTQILRDGGWQLLDELKEPSRNFGTGRFGFSIRDKDVLGLNNFTFVPAR